MPAVLWLAVGLPLGFAILVRLAPAGDRALAVVGGVASAVPSWILLAEAAGGDRARSAFSWLAGGRGLDVGLRLDPLSAAMTALVATAGVVVLVYSTGYFAEDPRRRSALAGLLGFLTAMHGVVLADGYLAMLVFWELVGAASARLIAFSRDDARAAPGAVRAFLTTRGADLGFYLAVLALFTATGTVAFTAVRPEGALGAVVGLGLVVAAMGKSAQAPLQTWLTGAMAGPTPVSALLHSATMVAAGVYLLMRSAELLAGWPLQVAGWVGALSAVAGAAIALGQDDLKRILAGSTTSQLGLMFVGVAAGGAAVGLLHLVAHAAGKACMFLAAGVFQRRRGGTALARLGGVGRVEGAAFACFAIGGASVAAIPPLAAFWSKEHIAAAAQSHTAWFLLVLLAAAGAAAYVLRAVLILWRPSPLADDGHPVPGRASMLAATAALAGASLLVGLIGGPLRTLLGGELPSSALALWLSLLAVVAGATVVLVAGAPPRWARAARRELYTNDLLALVVQQPLLALARLSDALDRRVVDAAVDGVARGTLAVSALSDRLERDGIDAAVDGLAHGIGRGGEGARRLQTGRLYEYLRDTALGAAAVGVLIARAALL